MKTASIKLRTGGVAECKVEEARKLVKVGMASWIGEPPSDEEPEAEETEGDEESEDEGPSSAQVRSWALANDVEVSQRGKISQAVYTAYAEAHPS